uniref:Putative E3 ubiquitin ligase BIG BROTHER-related n=1 Tax=Davidia involucrata TaxID=16924 RepID=A0A5B7BQ99_DAVIN
MENSKTGSDEAKPTSTTNTDVENPNNSATAEEGGSNVVNQSRQTSRTPFTNLSQVDADLALARTLQEQVFSFINQPPPNLNLSLYVCLYIYINMYADTLSH